MPHGASGGRACNGMPFSDEVPADAADSCTLDATGR
jgi:hypothetical protein